MSKVIGRVEKAEQIKPDWKFLKTKTDVAYDEVCRRWDEFSPVEIPHDFLIWDVNNLYEDCFGWYRWEFEYVKGIGEHCFLMFGGVYMDCTLYVNDEIAGEWKYGYSSFEFEITDFVRSGENKVVLLVRHQAPNSRWYSGAGIYRDAFFKICRSSYLPSHGTYIHTRREDTDFVLEIETEYVAGVSDVMLLYQLLDEDGELIARKTVGLSDSIMAAAGIDFGVEKTEIFVEQPRLWSIEEPHCYYLGIALMAGGRIVDEDWETVGFRTFAFDPQKGFFLNDHHVKLHGVCEHHDLGCLGAAVNVKALRRQFEILKKMGVNALRTSHNMPDVSFMELADEMGFVVMNEAFDMWERPKTEYDYARFFKDWAKEDVASWIRRDRNHPSLLMWSIGNEIYDTHADAHGQEITRRLIGYVRQNDPKENAPITIGSNFMPWEGAQKCADLVKYAGYNYGEKYYEEHHNAHPDWIIYGSETASVVQSRGVYHFPYEQSILADDDLQCSALGNSATSWGAESTSKCIIDDRDAEFTFGMFIWTGFDYIGEPTPYQTKNSYFGQIDTAGFAKDPYYLFQAEWTDVEKAPMVHLYPYWDFNEGQIIDVCAVSNASEIELLVNGRSYGRKTIDHKHGTDLVKTWKVPYEPGRIEAVAYEDGREVARQSRESFGDSVSIRLTCEEEMLEADGKDLAFITIETTDADGHLVENAMDYVTVSVNGPGRLMGLDNGDSTDYDPYKGSTRKLFNGKLLAIVASTFEAGMITVTAEGKGLQKASLTIPTVACEYQAESDHYLSSVPVSRMSDTIPVRKITLCSQDGQILTSDRRTARVKAMLHPAEAGDVKLIWKTVSDLGIEVPFVTIRTLNEDASEVELTANSDGRFRLRCMAQDSSGKITVISQLEYEVSGVGTSFLNPYQMVTAGLCTYRYGDIGNGNEKGISTSRYVQSGVAFEMVDFGEEGSDTITIPIFGFDEEYKIDIWKGKPFTEEAHVVDQVIYQVPSIWNTYQARTYHLSERFSGVETIGFSLNGQKIHIRGFVFEKQQKAFQKLNGKDCDRVYGDSFVQTESRIEGIGNNVTIEYGHMDFGEGGTEKIVICGRTPLSENTIHIRFHREDQSTINRMITFPYSEEYQEQCFEIEQITGKGRVDLVFLPGSAFDLSWIRFMAGDEQRKESSL